MGGGSHGSMHKKTSAPLAPWPQHRYLSKPGVGGGGGRIQRPGPAAPPPPPREARRGALEWPPKEVWAIAVCPRGARHAMQEDNGLVVGGLNDRRPLCVTKTRRKDDGIPRAGHKRAKKSLSASEPEGTIACHCPGDWENGFAGGRVRGWGAGARRIPWICCTGGYRSQTSKYGWTGPAIAARRSRSVLIVAGVPLLRPWARAQGRRLVTPPPLCLSYTKVRN